MTTLVFSNAFIFTTALKGYFLNLINPILVSVGQYACLFLFAFFVHVMFVVGLFDVFSRKNQTFASPSP